MTDGVDGPKGTVLFASMYPGARRNVTDVVEGGGFETEEVDSAAAAVDAIGSLKGAQLKAVVTDVVFKDTPRDEYDGRVVEAAIAAGVDKVLVLTDFASDLVIRAIGDDGYFYVNRGQRNGRTLDGEADLILEILEGKFSSEDA